jgi:acetolactate synthase-1/2/3 large subunit
MERVTDSAFLVSGGGIMHVVDSLGRSEIECICCHHEQGAAKAAEGYARLKNDIGFCVVTTGPGATNTFTGVAAAWLDKVPVLFISGQVRTEVMVPEDKRSKLRQVGPQELNVVDCVKPITKYAVTIMDPREIRYHLEKAIYLAKSGAPGPVWLDIPLDIQCAEIDERSLKGFVPPERTTPEMPIAEITNALNKAERPLLLVGNGIWCAHAVDELYEFIEKTKINVVGAMSGRDLVTRDYPYFLGEQGMTGNTPANYAVDQCDVLLIVGTRMQIRQTSFDFAKFAKDAVKIFVEIDPFEFDKINFKADIPVCADAKDFLAEMNKQDLSVTRWDVDVEPIAYTERENYIDIYQFFEELSRVNEFDVVTTNGMAAEAPHQALYNRKGKRIITNSACGEMGHGLPMALGACMAAGKEPVVCIEGDGSIMMNMQELQTILYNNLPVKIFLINNGGYFSIRNTHEKFFGKNFASDETCGLSLPDWKKLAPAWGFAYERIETKENLEVIKQVLDCEGPVICELIVDPRQTMLTKWAP